MKNNNIKKLVLSAICLSSITAANASTKSVDVTANLIGASKVECITFKNGQTSLSSDDRKELKNLVNSTGTKNIDEIKVLSWSDKKYPNEGKVASDKDIALAEKRGAAVKKYLKALAVGDVDLHNMAKRPNELQQFFKTDDYDVKKTAEKTGMTSDVEKDLFNNHGGASTSLVMVVLEKTNQ